MKENSALRYSRFLIGYFCALGFAMAGCTSVGSIDSAENLGLSAVPAQTANTPERMPVPDALKTVATKPNGANLAIPDNDNFYAGLPTGPKNTGTYPNFADQPAARIINPSQAETDQLIAQLEALEAAQQAGTISLDSYNQRLAALKQLAANHSSAMLKKIESRSAN